MRERQLLFPRRGLLQPLPGVRLSTLAGGRWEVKTRTIANLLFAVYIKLGLLETTEAREGEPCTCCSTQSADVSAKMARHGKEPPVNHLVVGRETGSKSKKSVPAEGQPTASSFLTESARAKVPERPGRHSFFEDGLPGAS